MWFVSKIVTRHELLRDTEINRAFDKKAIETSPIIYQQKCAYLRNLDCLRGTLNGFYYSFGEQQKSD